MKIFIADEIFLRIGSLMCLWRIKGLLNRLQHLDDNQDMTVNEGTDGTKMFIFGSMHMFY